MPPEHTATRYASIFRDGLFSDRVVVVTGGGSGIGRCIAHELAALGATVIITGRRQDKLDAVVAELRADADRGAAEGGTADDAPVHHDRPRFDQRVFDIRDEAAVADAIADIVRVYGRIDHLVNNAGGQFPAPAQLISQRGFDAVVRTNLTGGFLVARECFERSMQQTGGSIVNMLADMWRGMPGMAHSGAARAGMLNLTRTLAVEWAPQGVRVNAVAPGWVASSGLDTYDDAIKAMIPTLAGAVPLKRLATEAEVSAAVCFLLSPAAAFITGTCLRVDGGAPLAPLHWPMPDHDNSPPFQGFHRAVLPEVLRKPEDP
ncbi:MAG: SDR family oxidoreductase [Deltaproteobacteria bacterium]|nr:MAG: SDR family oxidoreductase [Deltaproteobacteria bacterium]